MYLALSPQMIALGVVFHKGSYLRGAFNILDFLILVSNIAPIVVYLIVIQSQPQVDSDMYVREKYIVITAPP